MHGSTSVAELIRSAPDGSSCTLSLPPEAGVLEWFGKTRFAGPEFLRDLGFAPAGQHQVIPRKIFPGGRQETFRRRGFDLMLFEATDRSDSCLVWVGPHHEATTWFGGPAPRRDVLDRMVSTLTFTDSPSGAYLTAEPAANLQQYATMLVGQNDQLLLMISDAPTQRHLVPTAQGTVRGDAEIWRERLELDGVQRDMLAGTPFEWRYLIVFPTAIVEVIFPVSPTATQTTEVSDETLVTSVLSGLQASWSR
jgi:hypothetical protein